LQEFRSSGVQEFRRREAGGGSAREDLRRSSRSADLAVSEKYGMTGVQEFNLGVGNSFSFWRKPVESLMFPENPLRPRSDLRAKPLAALRFCPRGQDYEGSSIDHYFEALSHGFRTAPYASCRHRGRLRNVRFRLVASLCRVGVVLPTGSLYCVSESCFLSLYILFLTFWVFMTRPELLNSCTPPLVLFAQGLGVRFAVRIKEFLSALLPRRSEFGRCNVPVRPAFPGNGP